MFSKTESHIIESYRINRSRETRNHMDLPFALFAGVYHEDIRGRFGCSESKGQFFHGFVYRIGISPSTYCMGGRMKVHLSHS